VLWRAIEHLCAGGCELLDFGRTSLHNEGLRRFKLGWATDEHMITYRRFETRKSRWTAAADRAPARLYGWMFRAMPVTLNRLAGAVLYPHLD
jgi:hypothetical protein